jgi:hypothetical protein
MDNPLLLFGTIVIVIILFVTACFWVTDEFVSKPLCLQYNENNATHYRWQNNACMVEMSPGHWVPLSALNPKTIPIIISH